MDKHLNKYRIRKRVLKMPATLKKPSIREQQLARARELSGYITNKTIDAGISQQELEKNTYKVFLDVKRSLRTDRS